MKLLPRTFLFLLPFFLCCDTPSVDDDLPENPWDVNVKIAYAEDQERLDNIGGTSEIAPGRAAQTPTFRNLSVHFIELIPDELTPYKEGQSIYEGREVSASNPNPFGFTTAIDFESAQIDQAGSGEVYLTSSIADLTPGTYRHARVSVSYQKYDVNFNLNNVPTIGDLKNESGTIASFLGYNAYLKNIEVNQLTQSVEDFKLQGYWLFETALGEPYASLNNIYSGQSAQGGTTVVNPFPNSPIPQGSCVVSGSFETPLVITGDETADINLKFSFSTNQSFEWEDLNGNGEWDLDAQEPSLSEPVVDMGLRGLKIYQE